MCISSALKPKQNQRSTALEPAFTKINLSSEESRKRTGKKDSCASFDDRRAESLNKKESVGAVLSLMSNDPAQLLKFFLSVALVLTGTLRKASEPARSWDWLQTS